MASGGPTSPSSWNRFEYVGGDPINYSDSEGLKRARIDWTGGEGPRIGPLFTDFGPSAVDLPPEFAGFDPEEYQVSRKDCFKAAGANLSDMQRGLLGGRDWSSLGTAQQANFLNITAALTAAGLDYSGLVATEFKNDRILFGPDETFRRAVQAGAADGTFLSDFLLPLSPAHKGYKDQGGFRQNVATGPLQISFGGAGIDIDVDYWNGVRDVVGMFQHMFGEGLVNLLNGSSTSPYSVARVLRARGVNLGHDCN